MNDRIHILRQAVVKITQMLTGKGIHVTQQGISAYVKPGPNGEPVQVNLPYLPDNASEALCAAIQGFLDHEVAHILFTDFKEMNSIRNQRMHNMVNIIEDARIEKAMAERFQGCGLNLRVTGEFFLDKYVLPQIAEAKKKGDEAGVKALLMVPAIRALSGQATFKEFFDAHPDLAEAFDEEMVKLKPLAAKLTGCKSTKEAKSLALDVFKALTEDEPDEEGGAGGPPTAKPKPAPKGGAGKGSGSSGGGVDPGEEDDEPSGAGEPGEKGEGASGEEEGESGAGKGEDEEAAGEDEEGAGEAEAEAEAEDEGEEEAAEQPDQESVTGRTSPVLDALDRESKNDFDATMSNLISNATADTAKHSDYMVYTTDHDLVEPLHVSKKFDARMTKNMADSVDHMVGPLQKDLERAISARSMAVWENGRRSGRLHGANLSRLAVGDSRVFRVRHETHGKDVAVELVIDASGSMSGSKIHIAAQAAYALASVLDRINIKNEVICFTTKDMPIDYARMEAEERKMGKSYARREALYMPVLKGFNERMGSTEVRNRFAWLPNAGFLANNVDGECVEVAARRLLTRRENGKIMIVLSDGAPAASGGAGNLQRHLKKVVKDVERAGVKTVGMGIMSEEVRKFYPRNMVIQNIGELPVLVMKELRALLIN